MIRVTACTVYFRNDRISRDSEVDRNLRRIGVGESLTGGGERRVVGMDNDHCVTVKFVVLAVVPPGVVMEIFPVCAPVGTVAVTPVSEFTVNAVAFTPPKVTVLV